LGTPRKLEAGDCSCCAAAANPQTAQGGSDSSAPHGSCEAPRRSGSADKASGYGHVARLSETLKDEYALALRRIDGDGVSVVDYAAEAGITANNAGVRVFRARQALRKRVVRWCGSCASRGCIDCTCGEPGSTGCNHRDA